MAIPKMNDDVEIISKLGDVPGSDDGLSTQQLKSKFDLAAVLIKNFINNVLIPAIENSVSEDGLLSQVYSALSKKLDISGGTMTGAINMNSKRLYNIRTPSDAKDAAHKEYVDTAEKNAKNYTDSKHKEFLVTLTTNWEGDGSPYRQTIPVEGILFTDRPHVAPVYSDTVETALVQQEAWAMVGKAVTSENTITFYCFEDKPSTAIPIQIEVNR